MIKTQGLQRELKLVGNDNFCSGRAIKAPLGLIKNKVTRTDGHAAEMKVDWSIYSIRKVDLISSRTLCNSCFISLWVFSLLIKIFMWSVNLYLSIWWQCIKVIFSSSLIMVFLVSHRWYLVILIHIFIIWLFGVLSSRK